MSRKTKIIITIAAILFLLVVAALFHGGSHVQYDENGNVITEEQQPQ